MENKDIIQMYHHSLHLERITTGRIAAMTTFIIAPIFYLKDIYMTEYLYSTFFWRALPMIFSFLFLVLSFTKIRHNAIVIMTLYLGVIYSVLIMMFGIFFINYGTGDGRFNSFLIAGMITTLLIIQLFSAPIRKHIVGISIVVLLFFVVTFLIKGGDSFIVSNMINPTATIMLITMFAYLNEKKSFSDFKSKVLLELNERDLSNEVAYRRVIENELKDEVLHDALTSIYNKRAAEKILVEKMGQLRRENRLFSLVFIDLDDLKLINDSKGHDEGDQYLISFTTSVSDFLCQGQLIFRVGGDEFLIFLEDTNAEEANAVMEVVTDLCVDLSIRFSNGISTSIMKDDRTLDTIIKDADIKMYNQKRRKKQLI